MRISDWSSDVCSSDLRATRQHLQIGIGDQGRDLDDRIGVRIEPGHFQVDPDQVVFARLHVRPVDACLPWARAASYVSRTLRTHPSYVATISQQALGHRQQAMDTISHYGVLSAKIGSASCRERVCRYV